MLSTLRIHYISNRTKKKRGKYLDPRRKKKVHVVYWIIKSFEIVSKTKYY